MRQWIVWALSAIFVVLNYVQQVFPNVAAHELAHDFHVDKGDLGEIVGAYFLAYATLQIPVGYALDRLGVRILLSCAIAIAGVGALAFANAYTTEQAWMARLAMGTGAAFSFLGCLKLIQGWFPANQFSTLAGITSAAALVGAMGGIPLAALAIHQIGWRKSMAWMGYVDLVLALVVFLYVRDHSPTRPLVLAGVSQTTDATRQIRPMLKDRQVWLNAIYATSISLVLIAFGGLWGASFIHKAYGISELRAADTASILFFGGMVGSIFFGWFSDYVGSRTKPMILAAAGGLITLSITFLDTLLPIDMFEVGLFFVGFFAGAGIISYTVAKELYKKSTGLSIGFLNTCYEAGNALVPTLLGFMIGYRMHATGVGDVAYTTAGDYRFALISLVIFVAIGLVAALCMRDTYPAK